MRVLPFLIASLVWFGWSILLSLTPRAASAPRQARREWRLSLGSLLSGTPHSAREVHVALADIDGDGKQELLAVSRFGRAQMWKWNGRGFRSIYGPARLLDWSSYAGQSVAAGDVGGDGRREELCLMSDNWRGDVTLRVYEWSKTHWRQGPPRKLSFPTTTIDDKVAFLRTPARDQQTLVILAHNIEDAEKELLFYPWRNGQFGTPQVIALGSLQLDHVGMAVVDLDRDGSEELVVALVGKIFNPTSDRDGTPFLPKAKLFRWSPKERQFQLQQDIGSFPPALKQMFGAARHGAQTYLLGVENKQVVLCEWDGKEFRPRPTGVFPKGTPIACGDLLGDGSLEVVSVEANRECRINLTADPVNRSVWPHAVVGREPTDGGSGPSSRSNHQAPQSREGSPP
jgi:hypothetical protein